MKVTELREELLKRGLDAKGLKADLVARLDADNAARSKIQSDLVQAQSVEQQDLLAQTNTAMATAPETADAPETEPPSLVDVAKVTDAPALPSADLVSSTLTAKEESAPGEVVPAATADAPENVSKAASAAAQQEVAEAPAVPSADLVSSTLTAKEESAPGEVVPAATADAPENVSKAASAAAQQEVAEAPAVPSADLVSSTLTAKEESAPGEVVPAATADAPENVSKAASAAAQQEVAEAPAVPSADLVSSTLAAKEESAPGEVVPAATADVPENVTKAASAAAQQEVAEAPAVPSADLVEVVAADTADSASEDVTKAPSEAADAVMLKSADANEDSEAVREEAAIEEALEEAAVEQMAVLNEESEPEPMVGSRNGPVEGLQEWITLDEEQVAEAKANVVPGGESPAMQSSGKRKETDGEKSAASSKRSRTAEVQKLDTEMRGDERQVPESVRSATRALRIDNFVRPFTQAQLTDLLSATGTVVSLWLNPIKTHCFVIFEAEKQAMATREAVYNLTWPKHGKKLYADFVTVAEADRNYNPEAQKSSPAAQKPVEGERKVEREKERGRSTAQPTHNSRKRPPPAEKPMPTLDELFRKTEAKPVIYYLPVTKPQIEANKRRNVERKTKDTVGKAN
ncbi:hypothetical protein CYMTET_26592 [Cymbomonas tetramitiformis]|uniref:SAP domain-containing protein n=1 Tax=Cymbomonas tetramitiformis TaxID=36881 RepID=A0AAE0FS64_9CHLO|nr:hypothetical protein CYMTET_26592 [Cymbomonas tetramitiformis]